MKKIVSIFLTILMVAGLFVALIPTASAASEGRKTLDGVSYMAPPEVTKGELIMSEDFEDVDATLTNLDLIKALGWGYKVVTDANNDGYGDSDVEWLASVKAEITDGIDGNQGLHITNTATLEQLVFASDDRLGGGDYIVEYTFKMTNASLAANSGSGIGATSSGTRGSTTEQRLYWMHQIKHRGSIDQHVRYGGNSFAYLRREQRYPPGNR